MDSHRDQMCDKYCIFCSGDEWLAWPAIEVREIGDRPALVPLPLSDPALAGMCYLRSEFLPVVALRALCDSSTYDESEPQMLVLRTTEGALGLLCDRAIAIASLETSLCSANDREGWNGVTLGWANHRGQVVRVLDPDAFVQYVKLRMDSRWESVSHSGGTGPSPAAPQSAVLQNCC